MISRDQLHELSNRLAIDESTVVKEYLQVVFLSIFFGESESQAVYFKGGTAIRLLLKSGRFSEDLDFTTTLSPRRLDVTVAETVKKMSRLVPDLSVKKTVEADKSYTAILYYQPMGVKYPMTIHLDFSYREKPETSADDVLETDLPVAPQPVIRHLDWPEILAEKIRAFLYRRKGRDVYDLWFMLSKGVELDWKMVNRKTKLYGFRAIFADVLKKIHEFDDKKIRDDLSKFLPARDRGLVAELKALAIKQLLARQSFTITASENIDYSQVPERLLSGKKKFIKLAERAKTKITKIKIIDENSLRVEMVSETKVKAVAEIRARNRNGAREIKAIANLANTFRGLSYDEFINREIRSDLS